MWSLLFSVLFLCCCAVVFFGRCFGRPESCFCELLLSLVVVVAVVVFLPLVVFLFLYSGAVHTCGHSTQILPAPLNFGDYFLSGHVNQLCCSHLNSNCFHVI